MPVTPNNKVLNLFQQVSGKTWSTIYPNQARPAVQLDKLFLEPLEYTSIPSQGGSNPERFLWEYDTADNANNQRPGSVDIQMNQGIVSTHALGMNITNALNEALVTGGFINFINHDPVQGRWHWLHEHVANKGGTWNLNKYRRMRFWAKINSSWDAAQVGRTNFHVGTYTREQGSPTNQHSSGGDGGHYYHHFRLLPIDGWQQIILDEHPNHKNVGFGGGDEHTVKDNQFGDGRTYFDNMTYFYMDQQSEASSYPQTYLFDGFELLEAHPDDDESRVYNINSIFDAPTNRLHIAWNRYKTSQQPHDLRYAFDSFLESGNGFAHGAVLGTVTPQTIGGYNAMVWDDTGLNVGANDILYVAIQEQGQASYREVQVPLTTAGYQAMGAVNHG